MLAARSSVDWVAWVAGLALLGGCYSGLQDGGAGQADGADAGEDAGDGADGADGADGGDDDDDDDGVPGQDCDESTPVALRFLTVEEYRNTIRDLLGEGLDEVVVLAPDEVVGGFAANSTQAPSPTQIERFVDVASDLAVFAAGERLDRFVDCAPADAGCAESFVIALGRRAFRRPLTTEEVDAYLSDFEAIAAAQGAELGLQVVATAMLASPSFLYVGERTDSDDPDAMAFDLASRLSYFLWSTMPDDALLDAAASGGLDSADGVQAEVRRMLDDPRAAQTLASFSTQWLEVDALALAAPKHPDLFPEWTTTLADAAERETAALMEHVVLDGDRRLSSLLQSREAWVDPELAALYGVASPGPDGGWVQLPEGERAGLLTRAAFLAGHAHATENSWVHRGKVVRERLLCGELPPPPPVADDSPINDDSRLTDPGCMGCHTLMDPIGSGLDDYDPIGRFVGGSAQGNVAGLDAPDFDGGSALSDMLAEAPDVQRCFAVQMVRFAHRRTLQPSDSCEVAAIREAFEDSDGDIAELIVALAMGTGFRGGAAQ